MRFHLTYRGNLRPSQKDAIGRQVDRLADHKHEIRRAFHPQLKRLWETNAFLKTYKADNLEYGSNSPVDEIGFWHDGVSSESKPLNELVASSYRENGYRFCPLIRNEWSLLSSLEILFLRFDYAGSGVISSGDLDNRVKTLIDGLTKPISATQLGSYLTPQIGEDPFYCLLENDNLVTSLAVETDIRPYNINMFNLSFA